MVGTESVTVFISDIVVHYRRDAPVVKRISQQSSELLFQVRILAGAQADKTNLICIIVGVAEMVSVDDTVAIPL